MTYTVVAFDAKQGLLGLAQASSPMAVGSRCLHLRAGVGAVTTQGHTDPALGPQALDLLAQGLTPAAAIEALSEAPFYGHRQLGIVDARGRVAAATGPATAEHRGHLVGDGFVVLGNHLATADVLPRMRQAWLAHADATFEYRLFAAVKAGRDAGGDLLGNRSAGIRVVGATALPRTDLRVDWQPGPGADAVDTLADLVDRWVPLIDYYQRRPLEPDLGAWEDWGRR